MLKLKKNTVLDFSILASSKLKVELYLPTLLMHNKIQGNKTKSQLLQEPEESINIA